MPAPISADRPVRWGFLGAGGIADKVGQDLRALRGHELVAVAARDGARAEAFAQRFAAGSERARPRAYGNYRQLVEDPDVDVVYIATTHPFHHEQALLAIGAGKAVLVEKPVCLNAADTADVFRAAADAGVFAMEAMWMRTNPLIRQARSAVADGAIGRLVSVKADMSLGLPYDPGHRLYDLANGGGALLDLGIYPATFAWIFLGRPDAVSVAGSLAPTGADATAAMQWAYADGRDAQLWCGSGVAGPYRGLLQGSAGWIEFEGRFHRPSGLRIVTAHGEQRVPDPLDPQLPGYGPELLEVERCLRAGLLASELVPPADSIAIMQLLDAARAELGVRYPGE